MGKFILGDTDLNKVYIGTDDVDGYLPSPFIKATGGTESTDGDYKIHEFTSGGEFKILEYGVISSSIEILVVAGGGGGQNGGAILGVGNFSGAGGGAGGLIHIQESDGYVLPVGTFTITIGSGSAAQSGDNGQDSTISGNSVLLTALGGGGVDDAAGNNGGSGAGVYGGVNVGTSGCGTPSPAGYVGLQPTASGDSGTYGFGNNGGVATNCAQRATPPLTTHYLTGGGGGGAGGNASTSTGGAGKTINITGTSVTYAKGGDANSGVATTGYGDGGAGATANSSNATAGNSGIVVFRYKFQ